MFELRYLRLFAIGHGGWGYLVGGKINCSSHDLFTSSLAVRPNLISCEKSMRLQKYKTDCGGEEVSDWAEKPFYSNNVRRFAC